MRHVRARHLIASLLLCGVATSPAEPGPESTATPADRFVSNPRYAAWAPFEPGAWVRFVVEREPVEGASEEPVLTMVLEERRPDVVGLLVQAGAPDGATGRAWTEVQDEYRQIPESLLVEVRNELLTSDLDPQVTESQGTLDLAGRTLACTIRTARMGAGAAASQVRTWWCPDIPGGLARMERRDPGAPATLVRRRALAWSATPGGGGPAWPPARDPGREWVENPEFAAWAGFSAGSWVRTRLDTHAADGRVPDTTSRSTLRLLAVSPEQALVLRETQAEGAGGELPEVQPEDDLPEVGGAAGAPRRVPRPKAGPGLLDNPQIIARSIRRSVRDRDDPAVLGYEVQTTTSKAVVPVGGQSIACAVEEQLARSARSKEVLSLKLWKSPEVPGHLVRREFRMEWEGRVESTTILAVEAFGIGGAK